MRRAAIAAVLVALLSMTAACAGGAAPGGTPSGGEPGVPEAGRADVDVDTPKLRRMKRAAGVEPCRPPTGETVEGGLPDITLACLGGGPDVTLSALRGPLVVNLWAGWCGPCREEMPVLQEFHETYGDRVQVLGINYQDVQVDAAMELVARTGVTYPLLADPQAALSGADPLPPLRGLPFLVLVDESGRVVHQEYVVIDDVAQLVDLVQEHLGVSLR